MKKVILPILLFVLFLFNPQKVLAYTIFQDNFDTSANQWVVDSGSWNIVDGKYGALVSSGSTIWSTTANLDITTPNYVIDMDVFPVQGTDKNIDFRVGNYMGVYEVHFTGGLATNNFGLSPVPFDLANHPLSDNHSYHIKIILNNQHFQFFVDNNLLFDKTDSSYVFNGHEKFRLVVGTGSVFPTEVYFDNIVISAPDTTDLQVPLLKQTDPLWANDLYDSANIWSSDKSVQGTSIGRWGCAITSAAMVLQYYNITKLPNNLDVTPGTLNSYLKSTNDSNFRNGATNWQAIARMTKDAKPLNPNFSHDALEYKVGGANDTALLTSDINNQLPDILQENMGGGNMHFVVAKGINNSTFNINDPAFSRTDLTPYSNSFDAIRRFVPSNTDLSYLIFVVDPSVNLVLKDSQGNIVGDTRYEYPIADPLNVLSNTVGPLKAIYLQKPNTGSYSVVVNSTNPASYYLQGYLYDQDGNVKMLEKKDVLSQNDADNFVINYDKNGNTSVTLKEDITFTTLKNDINALYLLGYLKKDFYKDLLEEVGEIEKQNNRDHKNVVKKLKQLLKEIKEQKKLNSNAATILVTDIQTLIDSLSSGGSSS